MRGKGLRTILIGSIILIFTIFLGFGIKNSSKDAYCMEDFTSEMASKNYNFEIADGQQAFFRNGSKRMIIGSEAIDICIFINNEKMENEASHIHSDGSGYNNSSYGVEVSWVSNPHFYKKLC